MTKSFLKQPTHSESYDAGCLSGIISIFDLRIGQHSQKLISNRKHGSSTGLAGCSKKNFDSTSNVEEKCEDVDDCDESDAKIVDSGLGNVKAPMEKEMSKIPSIKIQNGKLGLSQSKSEREIHHKGKNKKKSKDHNVIPNHHVYDLRRSSNLDIGQYDCANSTEISSLACDLAALVAQLYVSNHRHKAQHDSDFDSCPLSTGSAHRKKIHFDKTDSRLSDKHFTLYKAMGDVSKAFLGQKLVDSTMLASNAEFHPTELMDALETLSSNKELLVKLIQDPSSPLSKQIHEIQDVLIGAKNLGEELDASGKLEDSAGNEFFRQKSHQKLFRKKDKRNKGYSSHDVSKIVVLKPTLVVNQNDSAKHALSPSPHSHHSLKHPEETERTNSFFSLKGIKRRLRQIIGENRKEKHPISMDGVLDRIPYGFNGSGDAQENSALAGRTCYHSQQISHPSKFGKKRETSKPKAPHPSRQEFFFYEEALKHLAEMLAAQNENDGSLVVSKSPRTVLPLPDYNLLSPRCCPQRDDDIMFSPQKMTVSPSQQSKRECSINHSSPMRQSIDQDAEIQEPDFIHECNAEDLMMKGVAYEGCEEGKSSAFLELEMPDDRGQLMIPYLCSSPSFLQIDKLENHDKILEKPERPSPVSVLEPFFLEEFTSPGTVTTDHVDLPLQPQQIDFEDHDGSEFVPTSSDFDEKKEMYGFVTMLLQASGMSCYGALERWNSTDQLLEPSMFEEVEFLNGQLHSDSKLLYDYINEVLVEIQARLFNVTPWVSLIKPGSQVILRDADLVEDICKGIDRNLQLPQFIEGGSWMDLRFEIEAIVNEIADNLVEEIMRK